MSHLPHEVAVRLWQDRYGVVHLLDAYKFPWCDVTRNRNPMTPNTKKLATCLRCIGLRLLFHVATIVCNECGVAIPNREGGSVENKHHAISCSLYDPRHE